MKSVDCLTTLVRSCVVCSRWSSMRPCLDTFTAFILPIPYVTAAESHLVRAWCAKIVDAISDCMQDAFYVDTRATLKINCDSIVIVAFLLYFYWIEKLQSTMTMQSPFNGHSCINIKSIYCIQSDIASKIVALHALTRCDSVAVTYGIGKTKSSESVKTRSHTWSTGTDHGRSHQSGQTIYWFHGCMLWLQNTMLFHDNVPSVAVGTNIWKVNSSTKTVVCHHELKYLSKMFTELTFRLNSGTEPWIMIQPP
jgi:hypothetical protein